ncbi:MAG: hypothetical protein ACRETF_05725 [Nevskiaceae bacterium]
MHVVPVQALLIMTTAAVALLSLSGCNQQVDAKRGANAPVVLKSAKLLIEHNATDEDTGFQGFADHDPWNELTISAPNGARIVTVTAEGGLRDFGLTELFFETSEPPNAEIPIRRVLERLPKGFYEVEADVVGAGDAEANARFTHRIPEGPELLTPEDEATGLDPATVVVSWEPVARTLSGSAVKVVGYQVIVEEDAEPAFPQGFYKPVMSVYLPASATSVGVPTEFMTDNACWKYEVLAIEDSGNQTLASAAFETGRGCNPRPEPPEVLPRLTQAKILIEHNATDADTGFQAFADGNPWNELTITGPGGVEVAKVTPAGGLFDFGLTELFFETSEPENAVVPIPDVLAHLPAGTYTFRGVMVGGGISAMTATLSHDIPAGPRLLTPAPGAIDVDPDHTVVSWAPVATDIDGGSVTIVGYQVIVAEDLDKPPFPDTFAQPVFSIYVPASVTQVSVPVEFMRGDTTYKFEVLAIERSGNQTLSEAEFTTR